MFKKEKIEELLKIRETELALHEALEELQRAFDFAPHDCDSEFCQKTQVLYSTAFKEAEAAMMELHRRKYDEKFTEAEIDALLSIHQHPAWKKAVKIFDSFDESMNEVLGAQLSAAADRADKLREEQRGGKGRKGKKGKNGHDSA